MDVGVQAMRSGADDYLVKPLRESAVVASLENALHKRRLEQEVENYSQRVCRYSLEIARAMGWQEKELGSLTRGAYLHDIGKLGVPDGILLKPGALTPEERKIMQRHAQIGFDLVKDIPFLADATDVILFRLDLMPD